MISDGQRLTQAIGLAVAAIFVSLPGAALTLARDGVPQATIVVAKAAIAN